MDFQYGYRCLKALKGSGVRKNWSAVAGWVISALGTVLWLYGYYATGNAPLVNWQSYTPWWISTFLPNIESEIGMVLLCVGTIAIYWPRRT
jgi:hypothetical protein